MRTTKRFPRLVTLLCAASLTFAVAACGDDDDDDDDDVVMFDASPPVDADTTPDADIDAGPMTTRSGLFAVTNTKVQVGGATIAQLGAILINYSEVTGDTGNVLYDDRDALGQGCIVTGYDRDGADDIPGNADDEAPAPEVGEGDFTFSGNALNLRPTGGISCTFNAQAGTFIDPTADPDPDYECIDKAGDATAVSAWAVLSADPALSGYTITNDPDTFDLGMAGMALETTGSTTAQNDAARPILGLVCADGLTPPFGAGSCVTSDTVVVGGLSNAEVVPEATGKFRVVVGSTGSAAPGQLEILNIADMGDPATTFDMAKTAGPVTEQQATTMSAGGYDNTVDPTVPWVLDDASAKAWNFDIDPASAANTQVFSCDGTGGTCAGQVTVVFGQTTTADVSALGPTAFPEPTTGVQVFYRCATLGTGDVTVPADAMTAIRGTNPTRAFTTVVQGNLFQAGDTGNINPLQGIAGLAYVGYSTPAASAK